VESDDITSDDRTPDDPVIESDDNTGDYLTSDDIDIQTISSDSGNGTHVITANGVTVSYSHLRISKTGDSDGEDADFYGENSAVFATNGATLTLTDSIIITDGGHANAVFSYGSGTTVNIEDCVITTQANNSGGIMTTGGGTMNAKNLTIETAGGSSAAIRSDRGGGTITVSGGTYTANGQGSPAIYSTAEITGSDVTLNSGIAQVVVIEGGNSVTLTDSTLNANHTTFNGNDSYYQAVLIYQSMSGDASDGSSSFTMTDGSITNANGDIFHVTNTTTTIALSGVKITNNDSSGNFLRASSGKWGTSGSNGGKVTLNASGQDISGNIIVDSSSSLALNLKDSSTFSGAVNTTGQAGTVSVTIEEGSTWTLTGNSYVTSINDTSRVTKGSYTLYVNGTAQ
ncbi:MAG: hypothetical protein IJG37_02080, partial [Synergistaceae bacterium]|nr:hypothetical protein [Synergistaceae bacterium]